LPRQVKLSQAGNAATATSASAGARQVTFVNHVSQTVWVAASSDPAHPLRVTGWVLRPGHSVTRAQPLERPILGPNRWR
jgi:hypothetical protein